MRLNRGTIILTVVALVIITAVLLVNNQAEAPAITPTVAASGGPLFEDLAGNDIARLEVTNNTSGDRVLLTQDAGGAWTIAQATYPQNLDVDQSKAQSAAGTFVLLVSDDSFESEALTDFGLASPAYVITADTRDGTRQTLYVGGQNPTGNRYYVLVEGGETPSALSEEIAALAEATAEITAEATAEATVEAEAESTPEADLSEATVEAEAESTPEAEVTPEPFAGLTLPLTSGTVYTLQKTTLDTLLNLVNIPPYVASPTPTATVTATLNPLSEVQQATATAELNATVTALFAQLETEAVTTAAAEVTAEATTEPAEAGE